MAEFGFRPILVNSVRNAQGDVVMNFGTEKKQVLDPRVAYITTNMMESCDQQRVGIYGGPTAGFYITSCRENGKFA